MKKNCRAILLKRTNYGDSSVIINCLTEENGLQSFIFKEAKKKNASVLMPLRVVEINYYQREESNLPSTFDVHSALSLVSLYSHPIKTSILYFISEFLMQILKKTQHSDLGYYQELIDELKWLDASDELANYPIFWMITWIRKLGIQPIQSEGIFFNIETAQFLNHQPLTAFYYEGDTIKKLADLFQQDKLHILSYNLTKREREFLLEVLLAYFKFHIPEFRELTSIEVLKTILS